MSFASFSPKIAAVIIVFLLIPEAMKYEFCKKYVYRVSCVIKFQQEDNFGEMQISENNYTGPTILFTDKAKFLIRRFAAQLVESYSSPKNFESLIIITVTCYFNTSDIYVMQLDSAISYVPLALLVTLRNCKHYCYWVEA